MALKFATAVLILFSLFLMASIVGYVSLSIKQGSGVQGVVNHFSLFLGTLSVLCLVAGFGLWRGCRWARGLTLVTCTGGILVSILFFLIGLYDSINSVIIISTPSLMALLGLLGGGDRKRKTSQKQTLVLDDARGRLSSREQPSIVQEQEQPKPARVTLSPSELLKEGTRYHDASNFERALSYYDKAIKSARKCNEWIVAIQALQYKGTILAERGEPVEALEYLQEALKLVDNREPEALIHKVTCTHWIGHFYQINGLYEMARTYFEDALELCGRLPHPEPQILADLYFSLATSYEGLGDLEKAIRTYQAAVSIGERLTARKEVYLSNMLFSLGRIFRSTDRKKEALEVFRRLQEVHPRDSKVWRFLSAGSVNICLGNYEEAISEFRALEAEANKDVAQSELLMIALQSEGRSFWELGNYAEALACFVKALETAEFHATTGRSETLKRGLRGIIAPIYVTTCELLIDWYAKDGDRKHLYEALRVLELSKTRVVWERLGAQANIGRNFDPKLQILIEKEKTLLQELSDKGQDAGGRLSPERRARILEKMRELQDLRVSLWEQSESAPHVALPLNYDLIPKLKQIFEKEPNAVIWEFIYLPHRQKLEMLVWEKSGIRIFKSHNLFKIEKIESLHRSFLKRYSSDVSQATMLFQELQSELGEYLSTLYELITEPERDLVRTNGMVLCGELLDTLKNKSLLVIVPHGKLHLFNWESVVVKTSRPTSLSMPHRSERPLGLVIPIVRDFSLLLLQHCLQHDSTDEKIVLVSNPNFNIDRLALVGADTEADVILDAFTRNGITIAESDVLAHEKASEANLKDRLKEPFGIFHFAGHAIFDPFDSWMSSLSLYDESRFNRFTATQIAANTFKGCPLVVLSACETGESYIGRGDELVGLIRAFTLSGAASIVATNCSLPDLVAPLFMAFFYEALLKKSPVSNALFEARRKTYESDKSPTNWALYSLYGNPFLTLKRIPRAHGGPAQANGSQ